MTRTLNSNNERFRSMEELPTGGSQPSLCVAYLLLTGTSGWALKQASSTSSTYALGTFSFLLGHSLLGFLHSTHPDPGKIIRKILRQTTLLAEIAPLALLNAQFYTLTDFTKEYAYAHLATALLPVAAQFLMEERTQTLLNVAIFGNLGSMVYLQVKKETGVWINGLIALTAVNHFLFKYVASRFEVPKVEIVTVGLSFFTVFAVNCLSDLKA